jgi:hypothetical protein
MYILLSALKKALSNDSEARKLIDEVYHLRASSGLIARAKKEKVRKTDIVGYLIKYVASPPIALYRITGYDGKNVQYWYREHPTDRQVKTSASAYEFIARLIQHIPPKGLKLIRHYGLYARVKFKKVKELIERIFRYVKSISQEFLSFLDSASPTNYRERLQSSFGIDPLRCPNCGQKLILYEVWHPKYGTVYSIFRDENWIDYVVEKEKGQTRESGCVSLFEMQASN